MSLSIIDPPSVEPVAATDHLLRMHLRLEDGEHEHDLLIESYSATARELVETYLRRPLINRTLRLTVDGFSAPEICLSVAPVQSIEQVQYLDDSGNWNTADADTYRLIDSGEPNQIALENGHSWPNPASGKATVKIDMVAGYGPSKSDVPPTFLHAIRVQVAHMFENRGDMKGEEGLVEQARSALRSWVLYV